jgi:hypothetical protein
MCTVRFYRCLHSLRVLLRVAFAFAIDADYALLCLYASFAYSIAFAIVYSKAYLLHPYTIVKINLLN